MTGRGAGPVAAVAGATLALALGLAASTCAPEPDPVSEAEADIAALVADRASVPAAAVTVSCPEDALPPAEETELVCEVVVDGDEPVAVAFEVGGERDIAARLRRALLPAAAVEEHLREQLEPAAEGPVEVDCGDRTVLVHDVGDTFRCTAERVADGVEFEVTVTVLGLDGTVRHHVEPTTTTVPTTAATVPGPGDPAATTASPTAPEAATGAGRSGGARDS